MKLRLFGAAILGVNLLAGSPVFAEELTVSGTGKAFITPDIAVTRAESLRNAKRAALVEAVKKINGPAAVNDPKVQAAIDQMVDQIGDDRIHDQSNSKDAANNFVTKVTLKLDDLEFRKLVQDNGIASTVARNYPILIVMDEFFTTKTDHSKPLREVVEYSHDKTATLAASQSSSENSAAVNAASSSSEYSGAGRYANSRSSSGAVYAADGYGAGIAASGRSSSSSSGAFREDARNSSDSFSQSASSASSDASLFDQKKDVVNFRKLVEYQPQNKGPESKSYTYEAILREAGKYDLKMLDNAVFKSNYFTGKPLTMEEMSNSRELARYVAAARDNKADYFMMGNTVIIDNGMDATAGVYVCDGLVTMKAFSTEDSSVLTADVKTENASGKSPDECRGNVANKLATLVGTTIGTKIQNHWKLRETYGQEYNVKLVSLLGKLSGRVTNSFNRVLTTMNGVNSKIITRRSNSSEYEVSLTYKGDQSIDASLGAVIDNEPAFKTADWRMEGTTLKVCLEGTCP